MIDVQKIAERIHNPSSIQQEELEDFQLLASKHPYSSIFSILLLKGLKKTNSFLFDEELKKHSYRISDRAQLFNLLHSTVETSYTIEEIDEAVELEDELVEQQSEKLVPEIITNKEVVATENVSVDQEEIDEQNDAEHATTDIDNTPAEIEKKSDNDSIQIEFEPADNVEENILHHAYAQNYHLEDLTPEEEAELNAKSSVEEQETSKEVKQEVISQETQIDEAPSSFVGWLHADKNFKPSDSDDLQQIKAVVNEFEGFDPLEQLTGEIERPRKEFFSPTKKAKESLAENTLPVSETLAKIYALQGNFPKAIEAYEQLILKYPEKKTFFAVLIQELKQKINK